MEQDASGSWAVAVLRGLAVVAPAFLGGLTAGLFLGRRLVPTGETASRAQELAAPALGGVLAALCVGGAYLVVPDSIKADVGRVGVWSIGIVTAPFLGAFVFAALGSNERFGGYVGMAFGVLAAWILAARLY